MWPLDRTKNGLIDFSIFGFAYFRLKLFPLNYAVQTEMDPSSSSSQVTPKTFEYDENDAPNNRKNDAVLFKQ